MISNTFSGFGSMTVRNTNIVTMSSFIVMIQCMFHENDRKKTGTRSLLNHDQQETIIVKSC